MKSYNIQEAMAVGPDLISGLRRRGLITERQMSNEERAFVRMKLAWCTASERQAERNKKKREKSN